MANLIAATSRSEADLRMQTLAAHIVEVRLAADRLFEWRAPLSSEQLATLGYDETQIAELTSYINLTMSWLNLIGPGGTISANDGQLLDRMIKQIYGLGGNAGIVAAPEEPA